MKPYNRAFLGLGSNLSDPALQLNNAIHRIAELPQVTLVKTSSYFYNKALIIPERSDEIQPDFVNAVIAIDTLLTPIALLEQCQCIENKMGRVRSEKRWEARIIDIDLLIYENVIIKSQRLSLPHPEIKNRWFVLKPLYEIAPDLRLPGGDSIAQLLKSLETNT